MTQELDSRIKELCELITKERDTHVFLALVAELNQRLEEKDKILDRKMELVMTQGDFPAETLPTVRPDR